MPNAMPLTTTTPARASGGHLVRNAITGADECRVDDSNAARQKGAIA
jgi:hypothetical protein